MTKLRLALTTAALLLALAAPSLADPATEVVRFEHRETTTWGESLYLLGDLAELGGGDPTRALRMVPSESGQRWTLSVELPRGAGYRYAYVVRWNAAASLASSSNVRRVSDVLQARVPGQAPERRVKVRYLSGWSQVTLRHDGGSVRLSRRGPGRSAGESLWEGEVRTRARELSFELSDGGSGRDRAPGGERYRSRLNELTLASGAIHAGHPDPRALGERGRVVRVSNWRSKILGNARDVFVYLPRGYDQSAKRYPVVYMHDGQNLFGPDAMFGGWRVERALDEGISAGRIRELIVVAPANTSARMSEYMPEGDGGSASAYGRFLSDELKPWADRELRTLPGREHTGVVGSSLGGLVSLYLGWTRSEVFGKVGSLSGSFWLRGWVDKLGAAPRHKARVWLDSGNEGGSRFDSMEDTLFVRDELLRRGWALQGDLRHHVHYGARHNERYWRERVGDVLAFLYPAQ